MITLLDGVHRSQTGCRIRGQITEGTLLDKLTMFKHNNPARVLQCADAMGNDGASSGHLTDRVRRSGESESVNAETTKGGFLNTCYLSGNARHDIFVTISPGLAI